MAADLRARLPDQPVSGWPDGTVTAAPIKGGTDREPVTAGSPAALQVMLEDARWQKVAAGMW